MSSNESNEINSDNMNRGKLEKKQNELKQQLEQITNNLLHLSNVNKPALVSPSSSSSLSPLPTPVQSTTLASNEETGEIKKRCHKQKNKRNSLASVTHKRKIAPKNVSTEANRISKRKKKSLSQGTLLNNYVVVDDGDESEDNDAEDDSGMPTEKIDFESLARFLVISLL